MYQPDVGLVLLGPSKNVPVKTQAGVLAWLEPRHSAVTLLERCQKMRVVFSNFHVIAISGTIQKALRREKRRQMRWMLELPEHV